MIDFQYSFQDDWSSGLAFYRTIGIFIQRFLHRGVFLEANFNNSMHKPIENILSSWFLFISAIFAFIFLIDCLICYYNKAGLKKTINMASLFLVGLLGSAGLARIFPKIAVAKLVLVTAPYLLLSLGLLYLVQNQIAPKFFSNKDGAARPLVNPFIFLILMVLTGFAMQFLRLGPAVKIPALFIPYDILLWGILGLFLFVHSHIKIKLLYQTLFVVMLVFVYEVPLNSLLTIKSPAPIDISPLLASNLNRSDYLDSRSGLCKFDYDDQTKTVVYAAVLGCDLKYSAARKESLSINFLAKDK